VTQIYKMFIISKMVGDRDSVTIDHNIAQPRKSPIIRKDLANIAYLSRVIADFVPNFVAMATGIIQR